MNKKPFILLLSMFTLASCAKTNLLYGENAYNSPIFDENYYTLWGEEGDIKNIDKNAKKTKNGVIDYLRVSAEKKIVIHGTEVKGYYWTGDKSKQFGYNHNLSKTVKEFNYGMTSKLFDGRVHCEEKYQLSRMQLDKTGFAMYFPKLLQSAQYLGFSVRGGTGSNDGKSKNLKRDDVKMNINWTFYIHKSTGEYEKVVYKLNNLLIPTDNGYNTFVNFVPYTNGVNAVDLKDAAAMSFTWECVDEDVKNNHKDLSDDMNKKTKYHLALMLYEVFIGDSVWK